MNEPNNEILESPEIQIQDEIKTEKTRESKKTFLILFFIGIATLSLITLITQFPKEKENIEKEQTAVVPTKKSEIETKFDEFNRYTSLKFKNYENLELGQISEGEVAGDEENPYSLIPGIITFRVKTQIPNDFIYMNILDKKNIQNEEQKTFFTEAYEDIKNKNPERISKIGKPWALYTTLNGMTIEDLLTEITNTSYPNTDYVYSLLFLEHGHEIAVADEESTNYVIRIFAIKGDVLIEIESYGNLIADLGLSQEDHLKCSEMTGPNEGTDWLTYNINCISNTYASGKYEEQLNAKTKEILSKFEIQ